jgi:CheY-like chemotaxis protein
VVFATDPKHAARIAPVVRRALIVDPNIASAKLIADLLKGLGAREVVLEPDEKLALEACRDLEPGIVFVEHAGPRMSGESFTRRLRRSHLDCRQVPIIMVTAEATASAIKGARDCGVHEFVRKPFTAGDVLKRIEVVATRSRDWIEAVGYVGPDRRRFNSGEYAGPRKRKADAAKGTPAAAKDQAMRILSSALNQFDADPAQALRAMREQASALKQLAVKAADARLAVTVAALETVVAGPAPTRQMLAGPVGRVLELAAPETFAKAG